MTVMQENQLSDMARKLAAVADSLEAIWSGYTCDCEGACPICSKLLDLTNDADLLSKRCVAELSCE
jgi:hypothetical protein